MRAIPSAGWLLESWLVNGKPAGNGTGLSFVMSGDIEVIPVFAHAPPTITPVATVSFYSEGDNSPEALVDGAQYTLPVSFSWATGSTHTVSIQSVIGSGNDTKLVLNGWQGGVNSSSASFTFSVRGSMTEVASYRTIFLTSFIFLDSSGAPISAQDVTYSGPEGLVTVSPTNSTAWLDAGATYTFVGATSDGGLVTPIPPNNGQVEVTQPTTVTIPLSLYPVSLKVVDVFGQPIAGANVTLLTDGGQLLTHVTGSDGSVSFADVPNGWFQATYTYLGVSGLISNQGQGTQSDTVTLVLSYPFVTVVVVFLACLAISFVAAKRRRSRSSARNELDS